MSTYFNFENTYTNLPKCFFTEQGIKQVSLPDLVIFNDKLAKSLNINIPVNNKNELAKILSGNFNDKNMNTYAQAYAGHQFGHFTNLGDGRAIMLGEHVNKFGKRYDIQLKGSGITPYSRQGDGKAALGPMLREYIISEAMHYLNIPTTRSLSVIKTGEDVFREKKLQGSILTRIASSHIRVGTFQYAAAQQDKKILKSLFDYTVKRHYSNIKISENIYIELLKNFSLKQINLITNWMRVGFIHGVMNTDNMTLSGETIDYGPCAFMNNYDPNTKFSSIDHMGRYSYKNQPIIAQWNIARFAETLLPLISSNLDEAIKKAENVIKFIPETYKTSWLNMMKKKLGLVNNDKEDENIINSLLSWMEKNNADYTNTFIDLMNEENLNQSIYKSNEFKNWLEIYMKRKLSKNISKSKSLKLMMENNPFVIPRNNVVEDVLLSADQGNYEPLKKFLKILENPYDKNKKISNYYKTDIKSDQPYMTFCGT
jgi:uncharacterized protein YdiU (UPF0061 family)